MTSISILGSGNMARGIGTRALAGGNDVQILDREPAKAGALAEELGARPGVRSVGLVAPPPGGGSAVGRARPARGGTRGMHGQLQRVVSCEDVIRSMMRWRRFATAHRTTVER